MSCEDYELEDSVTEEWRTVLDIVRRILRNRTDWIPQGQVLMEEIVAEVEKTRLGRPSRTSSRPPT
jgi:hypothetical protein